MQPSLLLILLSWSKEVASSLNVIFGCICPHEGIPHGHFSGKTTAFTKHFHIGLVCPKNIVSEVFWLVQMQLFQPNTATMFFFFKKKEDFYLQPFSCCTVMNFNVKHANWDLNSLSMGWTCWDVHCLECFPLVKNLSLCTIMELFGNNHITLPRLMGCNNCFSKIIADVFPH